MSSSGWGLAQLAAAAWAVRLICETMCSWVSGIPFLVPGPEGLLAAVPSVWKVGTQGDRGLLVTTSVWLCTKGLAGLLLASQQHDSGA